MAPFRFSVFLSGIVHSYEANRCSKSVGSVCAIGELKLNA
jgi:hypothetical protein